MSSKFNGLRLKKMAKGHLPIQSSLFAEIAPDLEHIIKNHGLNPTITPLEGENIRDGLKVQLPAIGDIFKGKITPQQAKAYATSLDGAYSACYIFCQDQTRNLEYVPNSKELSFKVLRKSEQGE